MNCVTVFVKYYSLHGEAPYHTSVKEDIVKAVHCTWRDHCLPTFHCGTNEMVKPDLEMIRRYLLYL